MLLKEAGWYLLLVVSPSYSSQRSVQPGIVGSLDELYVIFTGSGDSL